MRITWGTDIKAFAAALLRREDYFPDEDRDWSVDVATHLALAYHALGELEESGVILKIRNRPLISPELERAWRELLHVRKDLPPDLLIDGVHRKVSLSRFGDVIYDENETAHNAYRRSPGDGGNRDQGESGN
jgi:hypothetical protein